MDERTQSTEDADRAAIYGLLALLLLYPDEETFAWLAGQPQLEGDDTLGGTWSAMIRASRCGPEQAVAAHAALFMGPGTPPIDPHESVYVHGPTMRSPLAKLRQDMRRLGVRRAAGVVETEDHIGVLFYTMRQLILQGTDLDRQAMFFLQHIAPWAQRCFSDIAAHPRAGVYAAIARFAAAYLACQGLDHTARLKAETSP